MKKAEITYTIIKTDNGKIRISNGTGSVGIKDTMDNIALISFLETDLEFELRKQEKSLNNK